MEAYVQRCLAAGMNDHVSKPINPEELFRKLLKWIPPRKQEAPAAAAPGSAAGAGAAEVPVEIPQVPGLDTSLGLQRVMGKRAFYVEMLRRFVEGQGTAAAAIQESLGAGDLATAERLAHTAKGVSGNIGATSLQALAAAVEKSIRERRSPGEIGKAQSEFAAAHVAFVEQLRSALPARPEEEEGPAVDPARAAELKGKMEKLLAASDSEAEELLGTEKPAFRSLLGSQRYSSFVKAVQVYDFDAALAILNGQPQEA